MIFLALANALAVSARQASCAALLLAVAFEPFCDLAALSIDGLALRPLIVDTS